MSDPRSKNHQYYVRLKEKLGLKRKSTVCSILKTVTDEFERRGNLVKEMANGIRQWAQETNQEIPPYLENILENELANFRKEPSVRNRRRSKPRVSSSDDVTTDGSEGRAINEDEDSMGIMHVESNVSPSVSCIPQPFFDGMIPFTYLGPPDDYLPFIGYSYASPVFQVELHFDPHVLIPNGRQPEDLALTREQLYPFSIQGPQEILPSVEALFQSVYGSSF